MNADFFYDWGKKLLMEIEISISKNLDKIMTQPVFDISSNQNQKARQENQ
jgi:hypothetical protein